MELPPVAVAFMAWMDEQSPDVSISFISHGEAYYFTTLFDDPAATMDFYGWYVISFCNCCGGEAVLLNCQANPVHSRNIPAPSLPQHSLCGLQRPRSPAPSEAREGRARRARPVRWSALLGVIMAIRGCPLGTSQLHP